MKTDPAKDEAFAVVRPANKITVEADRLMTNKAVLTLNARMNMKDDEFKKDRYQIKAGEG